MDNQKQPELFERTLNVEVSKENPSQIVIMDGSEAKFILDVEDARRMVAGLTDIFAEWAHLLHKHN